jgi:YidC/Oxa1 family membrane protein insertase
VFDYLLYYPVTFILFIWHKVFGTIFGEAQAISWVLGIVFLTFTVRAILYKPFVSQVRSMKKMQEFAPEIKKIQKRYANDRQRQAMAMQKLQREHGVNPLGGCLPILLQVPVFIGLNHVLRAFAVHAEKGWGNYTFGPEATQQYMDANLFGSNLGQAIYNTGVMGVSGDGFHSPAVPVAIPLMILASALTHLTARHSVARQNPANSTQQTAIMNKLSLYVFPIGLLAFGAFIPIGLLIYFLSNNAWTLMQQRVVYRRIDREEEEKKKAAVEKRSALAPKPGQRPAQSKKKPAGQANRKSGQTSGTQSPANKTPKPGQKPAQKPKSSGQGGSANGKATPNKTPAASGGAAASGKKKSGRKKR